MAILNNQMVLLMIPNIWSNKTCSKAPEKTNFLPTTIKHHSRPRTSPRGIYFSLSFDSFQEHIRKSWSSLESLLIFLLTIFDFLGDKPVVCCNRFCKKSSVCCASCCARHVLFRLDFRPENMTYKLTIWLSYHDPSCYPLVNIQKTMENHHFSWQNPLFLWSRSRAM